MRPLTRRLLSSSAASALAIAFAATVSTTISTPAHAVVCVINDTGAPWTIDCPPGADTATNLNPASNGWPGTNDYTSGNQGIVVTVEPGAFVTPDTGTWYFGNSATPGIDDGGPFVFTLGNASSSASLLGDLMVGGNIQLATNNVSFTNSGNITGSVGFGVGNLDQSRMGGAVTFYNGPAAVIGGSVNVYSGTIGAGPSATQNFGNAGRIGGSVLLDTAGSVVIGCSSSSNLTSNITLLSNGANGTFNEITTSTSTSSDSFTQTHNGGFISATNTGVVAGAFNVQANDGAYLNNSGNLGGPVNVIDSVDNTFTSSTFMSVATSQQSFASSTVTSGNGQTVTFTNSSLGGLFGGSSETVNWSGTVFSSVWSAGNMATLINTGTIGSGGSPTTVVVNGDMGASATNGVNGTIFGNVQVTSINRIGNSTSTWQGNDLLGTSFAPLAASTTATEVMVFSPNAGAPTASYIQSSYQAFNEASAHSWTYTNVSTTNYLGGTANLLNNGNITGGVSVVGVTSAALVNNGSIGDPLVSANLFNVVSSSLEINNTAAASGCVSTYAINPSGTNNIQTFSVADSSSNWTYSADTFTATSGAAGGTALFTNSGNIGAGATVLGQVLASVGNSGLINGFVNVSADNYTYGHGYSFATSDLLLSADSATLVINTGGNTTYGAPGTILSAASSFGTSDAIAYVSATSSYHVIAAGSAIVNNSGNITGSVTVEASGNATLVNSGRIADPYVVANWYNDSFAATSASVESSSFSALSSYSLNTADTGNVIQNFASATITAFGSSETFTSASSEASTHGTATLMNSGNATIGNATTLVPVVVIGQASAVLNNSGTIFANDVFVSAVESIYGSADAHSYLASETGIENMSVFVNTGNNTTSGAAGFVTFSATTFASADTYSTSDNFSEAFTTTGGNATLINSGNITGTGTVSVVGGSSATLTNSGRMLDPYVIANSFNTTSSYTAYEGSSDNFTNITTYTGAYDSGAVTGNATNFLQTFAGSSTDSFTESYGSMSSQTTATTGGVALLTNNANSTIGAANNYTPVHVIGQASAGLVNSGTIYSGDILVQALSFNRGCLSTYNVTFGSTSAESSFSIYNTGNNTTQFAPGVIVSSGSVFSFASAETSTSLASDSITYTGGTANLTNTGVIDPVNGTVSVVGMGSATLTNSGNITESHISVLSSGFNTNNLTTTSANQVFASNENYNTTYTYIGNSTSITNTVAFGNLSAASNSFESITQNAASAGGTALLNNSGLLVGGNSSLHVGPTVAVIGDTSATLNNSGSIQAFAGNVAVGGVSVEVRSIASNLQTIIGCVSTNTYADAWNTGSVFSITTGNLGSVVSQSWTSAEVQSWNYGTSDSYQAIGNVTGGIASLTNTGNIVGVVGVFGGINASLVNTKNGNLTGLITGDVSVSAQAWNTLNQTSSSFSVQGNSTFSEGTTSVTDSSTTKFSYAESSHSTYQQTSGDNYGYHDVTVSNATTASLVNDGTIGRSNAGAGVNVNVDGTTASAINTGTIWGNLNVAGFAFVSTDSYTSSFITTSAEAANHYLSVMSGGNLVSGNLLIQAYAPYTPSVSDEFSQVLASSDSTTYLATGNVTGGQGNIVNSGKIVGSVSVSGPGGATLTNSGNITGVGNSTSISFGSVDVLSTGANTFYISQVSTNDATTLYTLDVRTQSQNLDAGGNVTATVLTNASTELSNSTFTSVSSVTYTSVAAGTTATLVNAAKGTIGVPNSNTFVDINVSAEGPSASFVNSGLVWADNVNVIATMPSFSESSLETSGSTFTDTSTELSNYVQNSSVLPGNATILPSYFASITSSFSASSGSSGTSQTNQSYRTLGGAASLVNNAGGVMIVEQLTISGDSTASMVNSGIIGPETSTGSHDYVIISDATNSVSHSADTFAGGGSNSATYNESGTLNGTTLTVTESSSTGFISSFGSNDSVTLSLLTSGGNATLVNNAGAVIGGYPVSIFITADQTASAINLGEIDGNITVMGYGYSLTSASSDIYATASNGNTSNFKTTITGNLILANVSTSYVPTSVHTDNFLATSSGTWSDASVSNVVSGVGNLTNASGGTITGNVTVSGPYGATLSNSGTIGGVITSGGVLAKELQVLSIAANVSYADAGNWSGMSANSDSFNAASALITDSSGNLNFTGNFSNVGGSTNSYASVDAGHYVSTAMGVGATLTNNSSGVIGSIVNPMTVVVDAVGPSTVINNGIIYGDVFIGQNASGEQATNSSDSWASSYFSASNTHFSNSWATLTSNLTGTPKTTPTSFANITTTNFTVSGSFSSAEVTSTVASPASYSGTGTVYGSINIATAGNISFNNSGTIGSPLGGGSLDIVSSGSTFSFNSVETFTRSGNTTDANISTNGVTGTHTFTGMSSSTTVETSSSTSTVTGGVVSFNNSGNIGGSASNPIFVYVNGPLGTTATNSGTIFGDLEVESDNFYNYSSFNTSTFGGSAFTQSVTNYSGTKVTSQSSTMTNTPFFSSTTSGGYAPVGGNTTVTNSGTITGELTASSVKNVLVINTGRIWQSVSLEAYGDLDSSSEVVNQLSSTSTSSSSNSSGNATSVVVTTLSYTSVDNFSHVSSGGNATLINSGTIGLLVGGKTGNLSIFTTDPVDFDGFPNVYVSADQFANVTNTGNILGNVYETVTGGNLTDKFTVSTVTATTVTGVTTAGVLAGNGTSAMTVTVFSSVVSSNFSESSVDTGGTATLINSGNIGQSFASSIKSGGCLTPTGGVYLYGQKGATIINSGLIGGDAQATAEAFNTTTTSFSVETLTGTQTVITINTSLTNTSTTRGTSVDVFHSTSTTVTIPTGGSATITNTGSIGIDELDSQERPVGTGAVVIASGQAGANITNSGLIQGRSIEAYSHFSTSSEMATDDGSLTFTFDSSIGGGVMTVGGTEVLTNTSSRLAGGGTATIINSGKMLSTNQFNFESLEPQTGVLQVIADSFGNATVINQKGAVIVGDVTAESGGNSTFDRTVTTRTFTPFGLGTEVTTYTASGNWSGGTALVDNSGNIGGYAGAAPHFSGYLVGGNVYASGVTAGIVMNRAGAAILGDASADSSRMNYAINSTTVTTGPGFDGASNPTPSDTFSEQVSWVGGRAILDNFGYIGGNADAGQLGFVTNFSDSSADSWGGVQFGNLTNEQGATVGGFVSANSLFVGVNNTNGNVTSPLYGGFANVTNKGIVGEGFYVTSLKGSTFVNAANAQVNANGDGDSLMLTVNGQNSFTNFGTIGNVTFGGSSAFNNASLYVKALLGVPSETSVIEFSGNTSATNFGIITSDLVFTNVVQGELNPNNATANATFTFGQGSVLTGDINDLADVPSGATYANLTINFSGTSGVPGNVSLPGGGIYQGNVWFANATNVTAPGRWILTGQNLYLGQTTINNPSPGPTAWLQIGTPLNFFLNNPGPLLDVVLGQNMDPLQGLDPFLGNSAVNPALNSVLTPSLTSNLISAIKTNPIVTGNITIGTNGGLEGQAVIIGGVSNSGFLLPGWALPNNTNSTLSNLIANTNQILPGQFEISGNYTQTNTGTFVTNFAPTINRPAATFVGTQAGPFAPVSFWLSVSPFKADNTPSSNIVVDGSATVNGTVQVYVNTGGLYVNGDSRTIVYDVGNLTLGANATTSQTVPSQFVHFGLQTGNASLTTVAGKTNYHTLNVVVQRTSYASVATNPNAQAVGVALDSAVSQVSDEITGKNGFVFANMTQFNNAQDMAGFLSDLDWRSGGNTQAAAILDDVTPSGYAALLGIDTGIGFRNQVNTHLLDNRGAGAAGDPLVGAFIQAYGMSQRVNSTENAQGINGNTAGLAAGIDFGITDAVSLGAAMGWSNTTLGGNQVFGGGMTAIQAGIYGTVTLGGFYLDATLWENFVHGTTHRSEALLNRNFNASYRDDEFRADAELGYRFNFLNTFTENLGVTPYIGFSYRGVNLGNFTETATAVSSLEVPDGALGVNIKTLNHDIMTPDLGVTVDGLYRISPMVTVKPMVGIGVGFGNAANDVLAEFQGGGQPFIVKGPLSNSAFFTPEAGLQFQIGPTYSLSATYRGAIGGKYEEEGGWLTLRGTW